MPRILTIVGARPQFIKAAAVSRAIAAHGDNGVSESILHTGQHFDANMSDVFFSELGIPVPKYNLGISGGMHGAMTGRMIEGIEAIIATENPDWLLIYGDTNSTLAGAIAAAKLHVPIAHVEAGLRSFNMRMPEEINRILSDRISSLLFCPTQTAAANLRAEGLVDGVHNVGDVMYDVALHYKAQAAAESDALSRLGVVAQGFVLSTCHRAENTDDPARLCDILTALSEIAKALPVVLPLHPRTRKIIADRDLAHLLAGLIVTDPLPFLDMVALEQAAALIVTDSGGVQKEAFFYGVPCVTMRDETEWVETVDLGWNVITGAAREAIVQAAHAFLAQPPLAARDAPYGQGDAAARIVATLAAA